MEEPPGKPLSCEEKEKVLELGVGTTGRAFLELRPPFPGFLACLLGRLRAAVTSDLRSFLHGGEQGVSVKERCAHVVTFKKRLLQQ